MSNIKVNTNDILGWQDAFKKAVKIFDTDLSVNFAVELDSEYDITNLRYAFPIFSWLKRKGNSPNLTISSKDIRLAAKAKVFLGNMIDSGVKVTYIKAESFFERAEDLANAYFDLDKSLTEQDKNNIKEIFRRIKLREESIDGEEEDQGGIKRYNYYFIYTRILSLRENRQPLIDMDLLKNSLSQISGIGVEDIDITPIKLYETDLSDVLSYVNTNFPQTLPSDVFPLIEIDNANMQNNQLISRLVNFYRQYTVEIKTVDKKANSKLRDKFSILQAEVKKLIPDFNENIFAELIFYYLLRNMYKNDTVFLINDDEYEVNKDLIRKAIVDARSYAEGLWQLIENACIHSVGKKAYFGMRIYKADTEIPMANIAKEAATREFLWQKYNCGNYRNNIFNETDVNGKKIYSDFIEFYVLDDAINDENVGEGVIDNLKKQDNVIINADKLNSIADIFDFTEDNYKEDEKVNYYIQHYGMRWLKRHVDNLNGILQMYSPSAVLAKDKRNVEINRVGACCYSNRYQAEEIYPLTEQEKEKKKNKHKNLQQVEYKTFYTTEYSILIPLAYKQILPKANIGNIGELTFDKDYDFYSKTEYKDFGKINVDANNKSKSAVIDEIESKISEKITELPKNEDGVRPYIYDISLDEWTISTVSKVELFAKALFKYIYTAHIEKPDEKLLFSLDFDDRADLVQEFIRVFSIFYLKQGENELMKNVQIAICAQGTNQELTTPVKGICFIIAGSILRTAYNTAACLVYQNADVSLDYVALLSYLCHALPPGKNNIEQLCPFDLIPKGKQNDRKIDFLELMKQKVNIEQCIHGYGCKISDIHVKLGSKIHINNFYEAELLFHNMGNVKRFAYLIARDIVKQEKLIKQEKADANQEDKTAKRVIAILGYENYSSVLIREIQRLVNNSGIENTFIVIDSRLSGKFPKVSFEDVPYEIKKELLKEKVEVVCYTVVPVGATLTTFHKLHDSFKRGLKEYRKAMLGKPFRSFADSDSKSSSADEHKVDFSNNYLLVAVGDVYLRNKDNDENQEKATQEKQKKQEENAIYNKYINNVKHVFKDGEDWNTVEAMPAQKADEGKTPTYSPVVVKYCIGAESEWHDPLGEYDKNNIRPIISVDRTSTLLNTVFQTALPDEVLKYYSDSDSNVGVLKPKKRSEAEIENENPKTETDIYVKYGHIGHLDNHYQFFFDFEKIVSDESNKKSIINWAKKIEIDARAYNVIISPLQYSNSSFLKLVLDNIFGSNFHLLHVDINRSSKEAIRTKYAYICEELKRIKNTYSQVNFYFVDDSVCTGATVSRAHKLILMLCDYAGISFSRCNNGISASFKKVILLINRNSYETAKQWVSNPSEDWCGFIHLCVPPYNTHADSCPACVVRDRFNLLAKRSATMAIVKQFKYDTDKHKKRTYEDFNDYTEEMICTTKAYYKWLQSYVYALKAQIERDEEKEKSSDKIQENKQNLALANRLIDGVFKYKDENIGIRTLNEVFDAILRCERRKYGVESNEYKEQEDFYAELKRECIAFMKKIIADEHYLRLKSMNTAYKEIVFNSELHKTYRDCIDNCSGKFGTFRTELNKKILAVLRDSLAPDEYYQRLMRFDSYIKVLSRDYIAHTYFIREAIFNILHCVFIILTEDFKDKFKINSKEKFKEYLSDISLKSDCISVKSSLINKMCDDEYVGFYYDIWNKIRNEKDTSPDDAVAVYRVTKLVIHRLAQLNSAYIIRQDAIRDALEAYKRLCKKTNSTLMPSEEEVVKAYLASIKTATMSVNDDRMCISLLRLYKGWCENEQL